MDRVPPLLVCAKPKDIGPFVHSNSSVLICNLPQKRGLRPLLVRLGIWSAIKTVVPGLQLSLNCIAAGIFPVRLESGKIVQRFGPGQNLQDIIVHAAEQCCIVFGIVFGGRLKGEIIVYENFRRIFVGIQSNSFETCPLGVGFADAGRPFGCELFLVGRVDIPVGIAALLGKDGDDGGDAARLHHS